MHLPADIDNISLSLPAGCFVFVCGLFPPIGALPATIPQSVLGGSTLIMFGSIVFAGFGMMARYGFSQRNMMERPRDEIPTV